GLGGPANWRVPEAQIALCRLARAGDAPLADRVRAIEALHHAARLSLLGNFEDGLPIWALVLLLDDDKPETRRTITGSSAKPHRGRRRWSPACSAIRSPTAAGSAT